MIGGGGREHALVWALQRSPGVEEVVCVPGNAGIATSARCVSAEVAEIGALLAIVREEAPDLVVIGPEVPLAAGLTDDLLHEGVHVFGPIRSAARLESSKGFAKDFMLRWEIATAAYRVCNTMEHVRASLSTLAGRVVVKADGLAAGKGVILCDTAAEALEAAETLFRGGPYGPPANALVVEEMLSGPELSFFALCDGQRAVALGAAQDHKRLGEGDTGPNTGGMGAYSTPSMLPAELATECLQIAQKTVDGMAAEGSPFTGVLFIGLMLTAAGPRVLEFNTRFGDPETEALLLRLETPLADLLMAAAEGDLARVPVRLSEQAAACVVAASGGYPGSYSTGLSIHGLTDIPPGVEIFHAGTASRDGQIVTAGGRVLVAAALGDDLPTALAQIYSALDKINFEGMYFRRDIGKQAL